MKTQKSTLTRRNFLRSAMIAPVGVALSPTFSANAEDAAKTSEAGSPPVPTRKLGKNGPEVSMKEKGSKRYDAASFDPAQLGFLTKRPVIGGVREKVPPQFGRRRPQHKTETR